MLCPGLSIPVAMFLIKRCGLESVFLLLLLSSSRVVIGEVDEELDTEINLNDIRAEPLNPIVH